MLSNYELELVSDPGVILTKNRIINKAGDMLGSLLEEYESQAVAHLPAELLGVAAKISKGENYQGLPYVVLDYPRLFGKVDTFAIRSFFWWGNYFSLTLQVSGIYQQWFLPKLVAGIDRGQLEGWYAGVSDYEWHHHFEPSNYKLIKQSADVNPQYGFTKIATKMPVQEWENAVEFYLHNFTVLMRLLSA